MSDKKKMGRPVIGEPKSISLMIRLDAETHQKLNELAKRQNVSMAELIRRMIRDYPK